MEELSIGFLGKAKETGKEKQNNQELSGSGGDGIHDLFC